MNTPRRRIIAAISVAILATAVGAVASIASAVTATATPGVYNAFSIDNGVPSAWTTKLTWKIPASGAYSVCTAARFNETNATVTAIRANVQYGHPKTLAPILTETQRPNAGQTFMSACTVADLQKGDSLVFQARQQLPGPYYPRTQVEYHIVRVG
jgi:hypothetical protein